MHRTTSATHVMMHSSVDLFSGKKKKNSLNINDFKNANINCGDRVTQDDISKAMTTVMKHEEDCRGMLDELIVAKVFYAKSSDVPPKKLLDALKMKSAADLLAKITSAHPRPLSNIGR